MEEDLQLEDIDFLKGTCLLVDKPKGWTSFDVVNKIRYRLKHKLGVKKIKVGHAGTLDPMATGLLIICTGKFTKKLTDYQGLTKEYTGSLRIGATTPSYDAETEIDATFPIEGITPEAIEVAKKQFEGEIEQIPPMFSAIKVNGQPLYKRARKGEKIAIKPRKVTIFNFDIKHINLPNIDFHVKCSKGTYIRSLAHDLGKALDNGAYLTALRRTAVGDFRIEDAWDLEELIKKLD